MFLFVKNLILKVIDDGNPVVISLWDNRDRAINNLQQIRWIPVVFTALTATFAFTVVVPGMAST